MNGFLNLLKPPGMTSSDAVVFVRRLLPRGTRVGHAGTLDPEACGILPIMVGKAARLFDYLVDKEKCYTASIRFGMTTDTQDAQGQVLTRTDASPDAQSIQAVLPRFVGEIQQTPSAFSAIKQEGKRLYELARAGQDVTVKQRTVTVHSIALGVCIAPEEWMLTIRCGKGTYVRTLCHDIGQALGCGAHMRFLLRRQSGMFDLAEAHTLETLRTGDLASLLVPMDAPLDHLPRVDAMPSALITCLNGNPLRPAQLQSPWPNHTDALRVYVGGAFAGIGHCAAQQIVFDAMLLEKENPLA